MRWANLLQFVSRLIFSYLLSTPLFGFAQESRIFTNLSAATGLSSNSITAIVQDQEGFIWIGTKSGINRYDGQDYLHFHVGNSSLPSNDITALLVDKSGNLWVGLLAGGLMKYDASSKNFVRSDEHHVPENATVHSIYEKDSVEIWVLSEEGIYPPKDLAIDLTSVTMGGSLEFIHMTFWQDHYWIGGNYGNLFKLDSNGIRKEYVLTRNGSRAVNMIWSMLPISDTEMMVGTQNNGLLIFNSETGQFSTTSIDAVIIRTLLKDKKGHIWIGTDGNGIYEMDTNGKVTNYTHIYGNENSIVSNALTCIYQDKSGNIWLGTAWDGISVIDHQTENFRYYYSDFIGEKSAGVLSIYRDEERLWLGSDGDGIHTDPALDWAPLTMNLGDNTYPQFIKEMDDGYNWIGTFKKGLFRCNPLTGEFYHYEHNPSDPLSISHNDVRDIESLGNKRYLVASWGGGLSILDLETEEFSQLAPGGNIELPKNAVTLAPDHNGDILVGTFGEGIYRYSPDSDQLSPILPGQLKNCMSILSTSSTTWLGTWGNGLYQISPEYDALTQVIHEDLSANTTILSILPDDSTGVFVSTRVGLYHVQENMITERLMGLNGQYHINSAHKDYQGIYYFGNTKGAISFDEFPADHQKDAGIRLLNVKLFNEPLDHPVSQSEKLSLRHDQNVLTFEYAALTYPRSAEETYQVKVWPLNSDWIDMGSQRSITLANLSPGDYSLFVKTSTSEKLAAIDFTILKPWWSTWWAFVSYILAFLLLLYLFRRYSVRLEKLKGKLSLEQLNREKEIEIGKIKQKFFINISHEIRTPLTLIMGEIERLITKTSGNQVLAGSISHIRSNSNYILQLINELLDYGKMESEDIKLHVAKGNIVKFVKEIFLAFQNLAETRQINYSFTSDDDTIEAWYDRDQLEKVLFNLLSNAFKYTNAGGTINVQLYQDDKAIRIEVSDNGRGITKEQLPNVFKRFYQSDNSVQLSDSGFGIGLSIVKDIVNLHAGDVQVESQVGIGTTFRVILPKGKDHFKQDQILSDFLDSESIFHYRKEKEPVADEKPQNGPPTEELILIVEDNEDIRNFIDEELKNEFRTVTAENGVQAMERINHEIPDLIISDVMMPEMDGIEFTRLVKSRIETSHIPVILLTARTGLIYKKEGYETGADEYITKPFNASMLNARIKNILHNRQLIRERIKNEYLTRTKDIDLLPPDEQFLINITELVDQHLDSVDLDAGFLSTEMGMSHSVIYKKLKSLTGFSIVEFIRDYRLSQAAKLLTSYRLSVAETCYKVGFSDRKYFSQMFKKKYGQTPSDYIKLQG